MKRLVNQVVEQNQMLKKLDLLRVFSSNSKKWTTNNHTKTNMKTEQQQN